MLSSHRSLRRSAGTSKTRPACLTTGAMVATGVVFPPAAPLCLFMHRKDIAIPKGTEISAYVNGDMNLGPGKFTPKPAETLAASAFTQQAVLRRGPVMDIAVMNYQGCAANCPPSHRFSDQRAVSTSIEGSY